MKMNCSEQQSSINVQSVSAVLGYALKSTYKARDAGSEVRTRTATPLRLVSICSFARLVIFPVGAVFGRPFVKRFALCYQTVVSVCLSCLSVTVNVIFRPYGRKLSLKFRYFPSVRTEI